MKPQISRRQAWCKLAVLIADGMPDPRDVHFFAPPNPMLDIAVDDAAALWRWAEAFGAEVQDPRWYEQLGKWHQKAEVDWHGYFVTLKTYNAAERGTAAAGGMAAVRAIADETSRAGDSEGAPEASAIATTQPGDNALLGVEEVAGPAGVTDPATAPDGEPDPCPAGDPDCETGDDGSCHDGCKPPAEHTQVAGWVGGPGRAGVECSCGTTFDGFDTITEAETHRARHAGQEAGQ